MEGAGKSVPTESVPDIPDILDNDMFKDLQKIVEEYKFEIFVVLIIVAVLIYGLQEKGVLELDNLFKNPSESNLSPRLKHILEHSLMVHLEDDELSKQRMDEVKVIYDKYNLPINTFKSLHWKKDQKELNTLPLDHKKITQNNKRPGAYGLAGSFYKCLMKAYLEDWTYLLFLEDDAIPILEPEEFNSRFNEVIDTLPDDGEGIYILGIHVYCKTDPSDEKKWMRRSQIKTIVHGAHSVLISKKYIHMLFNYIQKKGIHLSIDNYLMAMNPWIWYGDLSDNGMFRGLYKQLNIDCSNVHSLPGPINTPEIN